MLKDNCQTILVHHSNQMIYLVKPPSKGNNIWSEDMFFLLIPPTAGQFLGNTL